MEEPKIYTTEEGSTATMLANVTKWTFDSISKIGRYYSLDGSVEVKDKIYYRYSDGRNWRDFSKEELVVIVKELTEVKSKNANEIVDENIRNEPDMMFGDQKDLKEQLREWQKSGEWKVVPSRQYLLSIASKIPAGSIRELFDNAEKIKSWLEEGEV